MIQMKMAIVNIVVKRLNEVEFMNKRGIYTATGFGTIVIVGIAMAKYFLDKKYFIRDSKSEEDDAVGSATSDAVDYVLENGEYLSSIGDYQKHLVVDEVVEIDAIGKIGSETVFSYKLKNLGRFSLIRQSKFEDYKVGDKLNLIVTMRGYDILLVEPVAMDIGDDL